MCMKKYEVRHRRRVAQRVLDSRCFDEFESTDQSGESSSRPISSILRAMSHGTLGDRGYVFQPT